MSFLGETNATAAHAEGSLNTFNNNNNNNHQQQFDQTSNRQLDAQNQDKEPFPTTTQPPVSIRSPLQAVIAMVIPTSLQQLSIWTPFALLRHRSRPIDNNTSIKTAPDNAATQNPSKHMHSWTNPMAGMDLIAAERPKSSILKVRRLQDSIDSKYHGGSDCKKTRENFTALSEIPAVQRDNKTSLSLEDCSERQRQRTPDIFVALKEKPRYQGPKKSIWQAWQRDDPHVNPHKHGCILLRDKGGIARILKWEAAMEDEIPYRKPLSFVGQTGVKFIPRRLDKCNANAYLKDLKESVKRNYSEVDEEVGRRRQWKRICTRFALSGFDRHYSAITSLWQLRAAARQEASTTNSSDIDDDSTTTNDLSSLIDSDDTVRVSGSDSPTNETTNEDDDCMNTNDLSSSIDSDDTVRVSGSDSPTNETTSEDDDSTTTNDLSSRIDSDDTVRVSGSDSLTNETTNEDDDCMTTNDLSSPIDSDDTVRVSGSNLSTNETTNEDDDSTTTNAATQNPSKHMHSWTNPMAGMDSIAAERSKSSILKVRRLQDSIDSKYPGGSDCKKTRENFTALSEIPAVQRDNKTSLPLEDCSERQRQRTPDIFVALKEKPRYQGPKKSIWQAWERDEPHIDINKHGCILLRDVGGIARILKWEAAMEDEIPYRKPLSFVGQTGVKFIPRRLDKCNANAYLKDLKESVKRNYSEVDEEVGRRRQWKRICTRFALAGFNRHYSAITSQWQLRAAARQEASTTDSSDIDDDSTTTNDLSSRIDRDDTVRVSCSNFSTNETTNEDDDSTTTNDLSSRIDSNDTVRVSGSDSPTNETTNEDNDSTTTNDLSSRIDSDDTVRVSGSNFSANETTNEDDDCMTTNDLSSPIDSDDTVRVSGSNLSTNDTTNGESTTTRRHRRTFIKSTAMEVDGATVWVNGRRRSSRLQPKTGSIWMNGQRRSARFLS
ncbi:hypothetical protein IV203_036972 [Nitzschia inconspicua]|uniref:Uncharacterized protein n=1 Tax=Nitzschia inconspicua TaxID=303405 RepID=A0A9K3PWE2_9STRA|nr:hypothetical protein IV203_036972 [Nitzschia inconspicua]